jgi:hypothetical protein
MKFGSAGPASGRIFVRESMRHWDTITAIPIAAPRRGCKTIAGRIDYYCPISAAAVGHPKTDHEGDRRPVA